MTRLGDRPTGDLLVLMIGGTICSAILLIGLAVVLTEAFRPDADTGGAAKFIEDALGALIALLAGFMAGRTSAGGSEDEAAG